MRRPKNEKKDRIKIKNIYYTYGTDVHVFIVLLRWLPGFRQIASHNLEVISTTTIPIPTQSHKSHLNMNVPSAANHSIGVQPLLSSEEKMMTLQRKLEDTNKGIQKALRESKKKEAEEEEKKRQQRGLIMLDRLDGMMTKVMTMKNDHLDCSLDKDDDKEQKENSTMGVDIIPAKKQQKGEIYIIYYVICMYI